MEKNTDNKKLINIIGEVIGTVFFFASFIPFIYAVYKGFTGTFFGFRSYAWFFGLSAIMVTLAYECLICLLPLLCLIYQISFARKVISKYPKLQIAAWIFTGAVVVSALASIFMENVSRERKCRNLQPVIREYLTSKYGDDVADNSSFEIASQTGIIYDVHTPVLPDDKTYEVRVTQGDRITDTLVTDFSGSSPDFFAEFKKYIIAKENIPEGMDINIDILSIDFQDYHYGDDYADLFSRTEYSIKEIIVDLDTVTDEAVLDLTKKVWKEIYPNITVGQGSFYLMVTENGVNAVEVFFHVYKERPTVSFLVWESKWDGESALNGVELDLP